MYEWEKDIFDLYDEAMEWACEHSDREELPDEEDLPDGEDLPDEEE